MMPAVFETTVHDMKTRFSQYSAELLAGKYDEIVVKNRTTPTLRILPYEPRVSEGLVFGIAQKRGHRAVSDDWDINSGDEEVAEMFGAYL